MLLAVSWANEPVETVVVRPDRPLEARSPASVTVIDVDETSAETDDLATVVGRASGVAITRLGGLGDLSSISLRGSSARQVEVYLDGVPLNPDGAGAVDLSELPLRAFERVEIWRGNAPVGLGGTAMGGVVNLVSGEQEATSFGGTAGSFDSSRLRALLRRNVGPGQLWVSGQVLATSGDFRWFDDAGTRFEPDDDVTRRRENNAIRTGTLQARYRFGEAIRWTVFDSLLVRDEGIPGPTSGPTRQVKFSAVRNLSVLQAEGHGLRARLHHRARAEWLVDPDDELLLQGGGSTTRTQSLGLDLQGTTTRGAWGELTGVSGLAFDTRLEGGRRLVWRGQVGGTLQQGRFVVAPVVSAVQIWSRGAGESTALAVLPRLGTLVRLGEQTVLKANVGRFFRPPGLTELFGNRGALAGRAELRPERGLNADLAMRTEGALGSVETGVFGSWSRDLITYVQNAQRVSIPTNLGAARVFGWEGALSWTGVTWLDFTTNVTLQRTINDSDEVGTTGKRLPRLPWLQIDQQTAWTSRRARLGHTFSVVDGVYTDPVNLQRQALRPLHGVFGQVEVAEAVRLELDVRNVLGTRTANAPLNAFDPEGAVGPRAITDYVGYPLPGRSVWLSIRVEPKEGL